MDCRFVAAAASSVLGLGAAFGAISSVGAGDFGPGSNTITFSEAAVGTKIPFSIGATSFSGLAGEIADFDLGSSVPPSPSGKPYLYSASVGNTDLIEVTFGAGQTAVGAYFDLAGAAFSVGVVQMEFYTGDTLLGILGLSPDAGKTGGFIGGASDGELITRVIFRDTDEDKPISFRLDDITFIPSPGALVLFGTAGLCMARRRR